MPTKPHKTSHGKNYLDEAVAKSTYHYKPITRKRAATAASLGLFLGWSGLHNFLMRRRKRGALHFILSAISIAMFFYPLCHGIAVVYQCQHGGKCIDMSSYDDFLNVLIIIGLITFAANIIWGIVEAIVIFINLGRFPNSIDKNS